MASKQITPDEVLTELASMSERMGQQKFRNAIIRVAVPDARLKALKDELKNLVDDTNDNLALISNLVAQAAEVFAEVEEDEEAEGEGTEAEAEGETPEGEAEGEGDEAEGEQPEAEAPKRNRGRGRSGGDKVTVPA